MFSGHLMAELITIVIINRVLTHPYVNSHINTLKSFQREHCTPDYELAQITKCIFFSKMYV